MLHQALVARPGSCIRRLADVLARVADRPSQRLDELLPRNWKKTQAAALAAWSAADDTA